jgi:hypothetical protein
MRVVSVHLHLRREVGGRDGGVKRRVGVGVVGVGCGTDHIQSRHRVRQRPCAATAIHRRKRRQSIGGVRQT